MSEYLGKPRVKKEDIPEAYRGLSTFIRHFEFADRPRVVVVFPYDLWGQFEKATIKKYGSISFEDVNKAALEAMKFWSEKVLRGEV